MVSHYEKKDLQLLIYVIFNENGIHFDFYAYKKIAQQEFLYNRANITQGVQMKQNQQKSLKGPTISGSHIWIGRNL